MLCSMAHPSADGHQYFWRLPEEAAGSTGQGPTWITMSSTPDLRPEHLRGQLTAILWALGWATVHSVRAYQQCAEVSTAPDDGAEQDGDRAS